MSRTVISVQNLGKEYIIGGRENANETFREMVVSTAAAPFRHLKRLSGRVAPEERIWALKDVCFEVKEGEVVGVIGRNGAGKSTLLKILSRITAPTTGRVEIRGRVSSLLEVGTGFHPELTGRENIYLNGAILGMSRAEIDRKFDEIVDFAGVQTFLDTPVKRYSSGMQVRLAFAVAAHLEPEILIVDEVLAVGDAEFQRRCLGKMEEVARGGRTVLFVSHNMPAVTSLCSRAILLVDGKLDRQGDVRGTVGAYLGDGRPATSIKGRQIQATGNLEISKLSSGPAVILHFIVNLKGPLDAPHIALGVNDVEGRRIGTIFSETAVRLPHISMGEMLTLAIKTEPIRFSPGTLLIKVALAEHGKEKEAYDDVLCLIVPDYSPFALSPHTRPRGSLLLKHDVTIQEKKVRQIA